MKELEIRRMCISRAERELRRHQYKVEMELERSVDIKRSRDCYRCNAGALTWDNVDPGFRKPTPMRLNHSVDCIYHELTLLAWLNVLSWISRCSDLSILSKAKVE